MALPPHVHVPPEGFGKVLKTNRIEVSGGGFRYLLPGNHFRVVRLPRESPVRITWRWTGDDSGGLDVWLEKVVPGARYRVLIAEATFEVEAAPDVVWERPPEGCVWMPPRFWERAWWRR